MNLLQRIDIVNIMNIHTYYLIATHLHNGTKQKHAR